MREQLRDGGWWAAVAGGVIAFPIAVLLHELGHYGANVALGLPDPVLRYASASGSGSGEFSRFWRAGDLEAAAAIAEPWQVAISAAAGPLVSYVILLTCVLAVRRFGPGPLCLVFAIGFVTPFRWTWPFPVLFLVLRGTRVTWGPDEIAVGAITGIPQWVFILLGLASFVLGYWFMVTAIPRGRRLRTVLATLVGAVLGGVVWVPWLGPLLLP